MPMTLQGNVLGFTLKLPWKGIETLMLRQWSVKATSLERDWNIVGLLPEDSCPHGVSTTYPNPDLPDIK